MVEVVRCFCGISDFFVSDQDLECDARSWQCTRTIDAELFSGLRCDEGCHGVSVFFEGHVFWEAFGCGGVLNPTPESVYFWHLS